MALLQEKDETAANIINLMKKGATQTEVLDDLGAAKDVLRQMSIPEARPTPVMPKKFRRVGPRDRLVEREPTRRETAEFMGFDVAAEGGTARQRIAGGLGSIQDVKNALAAGTELSPEDFEVVNVEDLGIVAKGPQDEKFRMLDKIGLEGADIAVGAVEAIPLAVEAATFGFTKSPVAAGVAAGVTKSGLLFALKEAGILEDPSIIKEGLIEGILSAGGGSAPAIKKAIGKAFSIEGKVLDDITKLATEKQFQEGAEITADIAADVERVGGVKPKFTVGEELSIKEPEIAGPLVGAEAAATTVSLTDRSQRQAREALETRFKRDTTDAAAAQEFAETTARTQEKRVSEAVDTARSNADAAITRTNAEIDKISGVTSPEDIRTILSEGVESVNRSLDAAYNKIDDAALEADVDFLDLGTTADNILNRARVFSGGEKIFKESLEAATRPTGDLGTYRVAQEARSELRAHIRMLKKNEASKFEIARAEELEKEFTASIGAALENVDPKLADQLIETDFIFQNAKEKLDRGFIGKLIKTSEGVSTIPSEDLVRKILSNTSNTRKFMNVADEFGIDATKELKDAFFKGYRDQVISGKQTHKAYMSQIKDTGELIFTPRELKVLNNAGAVKNKVLQIEKRRDEVIKKINSTFNAKLSKFEPNKLVATVSRSAKDTAKLKRILSPEEWKQYQSARRSKAVKDMTNAKGELTLTGITKVLEGNRPEMIQTLGEDYIKDLTTAKRFLDVLSKKAAGVRGAREGARGVSAIDVGRAMLLGPLSHKGFVLGTAKRFRMTSLEKKMTELMGNPELLRERIRIFKLPEDKQLKELKQFWGGLGVPLTRAVVSDTDIEETPLSEFRQEQE